MERKQLPTETIIKLGLAAAGVLVTGAIGFVGFVGAKTGEAVAKAPDTTISLADGRVTFEKVNLDNGQFAYAVMVDGNTAGVSCFNDKSAGKRECEFEVLPNNGNGESVKVVDYVTDIATR